MPVTSPVPKEYAQKFDKESPRRTPARHLVRPLHGRERREGQRRRLQGRQVDPPGAQPQLGCEQGLPSRVSRRDPPADQLDRRQRGRSPGPPGQEPRPRHQPARPGAQAGRAAAEGPARHASRRRFPLVHAQHDDQAAGQPQRPQGDPRRLRPRRRAQGARRRVRRQDRDALDPAGHRWLRRGGRRQGPGLRLPGQPQGRHGGGHEVHEGRGLLLREVRR